MCSLPNLGRGLSPPVGIPMCRGGGSETPQLLAGTPLGRS